MGAQIGISAMHWPTQGKWLHRRVRVCFDFDTSRQMSGSVVRDDIEEPFRMIIRLDDGRFILSTECQYQPEATS